VFYLIAGFLCLVQVLFCAWAGIRALVLITQPQIKEAIRARAERLRPDRRRVG
jgi:hypothetical protein